MKRSMRLIGWQGGLFMWINPLALYIYAYIYVPVKV